MKIQETFKLNIEKSHLARTLDSYYGQYDEEAVICTLKGDQASCFRNSFSFEAQI